jgi:nucleotide-binding universal stress UspA family protein
MKATQVLVPTDFSELAREAVDQAAALVRESQGKLHLIHVDEVPLFGEPYIPQGGFVHPQERQDSKERLAALRAAYPDIAVETTDVVGVPADEIVDYAERNAIDLICISTHGRGGLVRAVLGSTTEAVVRRAPCPVLSMHHTASKGTTA